jgi:hypothetical protein
MTQTMHAYPKGAAADDYPLTVSAPVVMDAATEEGARPLMEFAGALKSHNNRGVARAEAARLQPYFSALSTYLSQAIDGLDMPDSARGMAKDYTTPGSLSGMFNAMARFTRNTIISDVVVAPHGIRAEGSPAAALFDPDAFNPAFDYAGKNFRFGFVQVMQRSRVSGSESSTTAATFTLDDGLLKDIAPHGPEKMLKHLQAVLTAMNHDMLHHFHSPFLPDELAKKFRPETEQEGEIGQWAKETKGVEEWSQLGHGKVFMAEGNEALLRGLRSDIDAFFDELSRLARAFPPEKAHEVADYFGTALLQSLTRTFPLNHPLLSHGAERLRQALPFGEEELLQRAIKTFNGINLYGDDGYGRDHRDKVFRALIDGYRKQGFDMMPQDGLTYRDVKLAQLAKMSIGDLRMHVPEPMDGRAVKLREKTDENAVRLFAAVSRVTGFVPK